MPKEQNFLSLDQTEAPQRKQQAHHEETQAEVETKSDDGKQAIESFYYDGHLPDVD